jgi:DNA-binding NarL/FixJ family response regulator
LRIVEPDLVIIGQNLEGFDSLQTFMALRDREEGRSMPVIFLTGRDELAMIEDHTKPGISGVIYKPFETGMLPQMINDIWSGLLAEHNKNPEPGLKKGCGIFTHG